MSAPCDVCKELDLTIDENNLLNEWKSQASLMLDYGVKLADAMQEEDEARAALTVIVAVLDREIRENPEKFGLAKITETAVANVLPGVPTHLTANERLNKARYAVRVLRAAVDAISHRKYTLQGMTDLFLRQWYADPKSPAQPIELREAVQGPPTKKIMQRKRRVHKEDES